MESKICTKCKLSKDIDQFYKHGIHVDGACKSCINLRQMQYNRAHANEAKSRRMLYLEKNKYKLAAKSKLYKERNKEKIKEQSKIYHQQNKEKILRRQKISRIKYLEKNRDKVLARGRLYYQNHKDEFSNNHKKWLKANSTRVKISGKIYRKNNRGAINAYKAKMQASFYKRIPKWLSKDELEKIRLFYINCPKGYHVDHIIPLHGEFVSGLHVLNNLQYLEPAENVRKSNSFPYYPIEFYQNRGLIPLAAVDNQAKE